ncbi:MAG: hypothetical protein M3245_01950, partial [Actinomycetota bacterium]|nr:hypothetical protein [Actinomycetota bacterium]
MSTSNAGPMRTGRCKVCDGKAVWRYRRAFPPGNEPPYLDVLLCSRCGLLFVGNMPTDEQLLRFYQSADREMHYEKVGEPTGAKARRSARDVLRLLDGAGG